ncbi:NAD-dependent epimerase/dehydratase family protein [Haliea sp. E17]|uniref:NAD-dependent epimerase/dehydratase family protein n=1 Tax=Haliea sp. E17 TaxID=3401576 RepID=UPI003AAEDC52
MKALVTGASGFIGQQLCARLSGQGRELLPFSLGGGSLPSGQRILPLDLTNESVSARHLREAHTVFHLAGIAHRAAAGQAYDAVNHRAVIELATRAADAGVRSFIFLSSVKAMGESATAAPRDEDDCIRPDEPYGLSKWQAEQSLRAAFADTGMAVYILRPALVYGPQAKGNLHLLGRLVAAGLPRPPALGARSMVALADLVELMLLAEREARPGVHTLIAADGESYSTRRIYDALRMAAGKARAHSWLPQWAWRGGAGLVDILRPGPEPTWQKLFGTELYSNQRARQQLGWVPQQTFEAMLAAGGAAAC